MPRLVPKDIVDAVRLSLLQTALQGAATDEDSELSHETSFSDADILDRINRAVVEIHRICKAVHLPWSIETVMGTGEVDLPNNTVRLLPETVRVLGRRAAHRSPDVIRRLARSRRGFDGLHPVYTTTGAKVLGYPMNGSLAFKVVVTPPTFTVEDYENGGTLSLDYRFYSAIIDYVLGTCYDTWEIPNLSERYFQKFKTETFPFQLNYKYSRVGDNEVEVEP